MTRLLTGARVDMIRGQRGVTVYALLAGEGRGLDDA